MSSVIKTTTPFISKDLLCEALDTMNIHYTIKQDNIITELRDYYGLQMFVYSQELGRYQYQHDSSANGRFNPYPWGMDVNKWGNVSNFLQAVDTEYQNAYKRLEEKKLKEEEERKRKYLETQKQKIIAKAESKGYSVKETRQGDKTRLVLVRTHY
ncbi:MAG: hypothetical protein PHR06_12210 [Candidatus Cloacimonetes bacterium]|nr:hypothetical protein [Candidatus Cloacimonadota bacterium]